MAKIKLLKCEACEKEVRTGVLRLVKWDGNQIDVCTTCMQFINNALKRRLEALKPIEKVA